MTDDMTYTVTGVLHDGLVYKIRHDATGFVSNVFVGRLIPSESRLDDGLQIKFPAPLNQDNPEPPSAVSHEVADDGAEHKEMLEEEFSQDEDTLCDIEDEENKWEPLQVFDPAPPKPPTKRGRKPTKKRGRRPREENIKRPVQSDVTDLWPKFSDSAERRKRRYTAESTGDLTMVIKKRPHPKAEAYYTFPKGPGQEYVQTYRNSRRVRADTDST